jgi:hypothetical protein
VTLQLRCHPRVPGGNLPVLRNGHRLLHASVLAILGYHKGA